MLQRRCVSRGATRQSQKKSKRSTHAFLPFTSSVFECEVVNLAENVAFLHVSSEDLDMGPLQFDGLLSGKDKTFSLTTVLGDDLNAPNTLPGFNPRILAESSHRGSVGEPSDCQHHDVLGRNFQIFTVANRSVDVRLFEMTGVYGDSEG